MPATSNAKENSKSVIIKKNTSCSVDTTGACVLKNVDETIHLQSERRDDWIREVREIRLQGAAMAEAAHLVSPAYRTHCSLTTYKEERMDSSSQMFQEV